MTTNEEIIHKTFFIKMSKEFRSGEIRLCPDNPLSRKFFIEIKLNEPFSIDGLGTTQEEVDALIKYHIIERLHRLISEFKEAEKDG